ncbi:hypothetical protein L1049_021301 [Liquidambar formosana]|uniref:Uncharacterized protein n=1 Tax=Liquidambar formosana TaxID=63359 RepID=A0AAP0SCM6_LIQFO
MDHLGGGEPSLHREEWNAKNGGEKELYDAMGRAATSLTKPADTAREELPSTMAAIRLSGMEISDLTLELSDLSQEITDGVNKST